MPDFFHLFHSARPFCIVPPLSKECSGYLQLVFALALNDESFPEGFLRPKQELLEKNLLDALSENFKTFTITETYKKAACFANKSKDLQVGPSTVA